MAHALGATVTLVTTLPAGFDPGVLSGLQLNAATALVPARYANSYDADGRRTQLLLSPGEPLDAEPLLPDGADGLIVAPAYHELSRFPACPANVTAVALQGLLRTTTADGTVHPHPDPWSQVKRFIAPGRFAFLSEEDTPEADTFAAQVASSGATAFVTRAANGATLFRSHIRRHFPAIPADVHEPTGAGDCFAAAFVVRFVECLDIETATRFAIAAGSVAVETGAGPSGVPSRNMVESRLRRAAA